MSAEEFKALKESTEAEMKELREAALASRKFAQKMKIEQEKRNYKDAASKRGIEFIMACQFDMEELLSNLSPLFSEEGTLLENMQEKKDKFIRFVRDWGIERERKNKEEREAYAIGNTSRHGWLTEKYYRSV